MDISQLPFDVLVHVAGLLNLNDLCKIERTCKYMTPIGTNEYLWKKAYDLHFGAFGGEIVDKNIHNNNVTWKEKYRVKRIARINEVRAFNANPTVIPGLDALQGAPQYIFEKYAINFLQDSCITRVSRGVYLSFADRRTLGLLDAFFETLDFSDLSVLESLTKMFNYIQFPSHFSVITRFMLCFAQRYYSCNTGSIFKNTDAVYVLAFGIIMLNTDIHNSAVKNKMTLSQYIHNSSGINNGENLPEKMLNIYNKIKEQPLVLNRLTPNYESSLWSWVSDWISKLKT